MPETKESGPARDRSTTPNPPETLPDGDYEQPDLWAEDEYDLTTHAGKFLDFHRRNPDVMRLLAHEVRKWARATRGQPISVEVFLGKIRYDLNVRTRSTDFKINNNHAAFYTRLLCYRHPEWAHMFEVRRSVADEDTSWLAAAV